MNYFFLFDEILKKKINFIYTIFSLRFFGFSFSFFNPCLIKKLYMAHLFLKKTYLHIIAFHKIPQVNISKFKKLILLFLPGHKI